ncbi:MAG: membrane protein insertase YidC [Oligoflexia bacterium]|nr:membrane protein insertase YidC [Oligoflexia bacterium]
MIDRRTLLAISLCFGIFIAWQKFYIEPQMLAKQAAQQALSAQQKQALAQNPAQNAQVSPDHSITAGSSAVSAPANREHHPAQNLPIHSGIADARIGDAAEFITEWASKTYRQGLASDAPPVDLQTVTSESSQIDLSFEDKDFAYLANVQGELKPTANGAIWAYEDGNVKMEREFSGQEGSAAAPYLNIAVRVTFKNKHPNYAFLSIGSERLQTKDPEEKDRSLFYFTNNSFERTQLKSVKLEQVSTPVKYVGASTRYFVLALVNDSPIEARALLQPLPNEQGGRISLVYPVTSSQLSFATRSYFGPKELVSLRAVDPTLDHVVDFGWFTAIAYPLLNILKWLYQYVRNYGIAIILLTVLLKVITFPLTYKSMKSMKEMARLQPQLNKLREQYKDNKEELNRRTLEMMRTHGYNPVAGCLPMVIQMPIFFALYRVLYSSIELYHAPFAFWIRDLSAHDPYYVTPVLMTALMFLQQKMTPNTATDPTQQKMMQLMPVIFGAFMLALPSGLTIYMLVNAATSVLQQGFLNKKLDIHGPATASAR